jgi:hypothetical protein
MSLSELKRRSFPIEDVVGALDETRIPSEGIGDKIRNMEEKPLEKIDMTKLFAAVGFLLSPKLKRGELFRIESSILNPESVTATIDMTGIDK